MIVGEESQANSSSLTKHKWNIEIVLSVLFEQRGPKRTKKAVFTGLCPEPRSLFEKATQKLSSETTHVERIPMT